MDLRPRVLRDGDVVSANGRIVSPPEGTWFEPLLPTHAIAYAVPPPIQPHPFAVPLLDVDVHSLPERSEQPGRAAALARIVGVWDAERLRATAVGPIELPPVEQRIAEALGKDRPPATTLWPDDVLRRLKADLDEHAAEWTAYEWWTDNGDGRPSDPYVKVVRVMAAMAQWAESLPERLLEVRAWLDPER